MKKLMKIALLISILINIWFQFGGHLSQILMENKCRLNEVDGVGGSWNETYWLHIPYNMQCARISE